MVDEKTANGQAVNCEQVWREISNYLEGEVDGALRAAMDQHFRTCKRCTSVLEGTHNVVRLYSDERMIEVPAGFGRRLEKRLAQRARATTSRWSTWSAWLVPVAALVLITGGLEIASSLTNPHPMKSEHAQPAHGIPPDMQVVVSTDAKVFHVPGCDFIHNRDKVRRLTAKEAVEQGYIPCLRCMRKYLDTASAGRLGSESELVVETEGDDHTYAAKP
jgi:methylphosphotriester-DNA--protein-cysteine methyltransferase